MQLFTDKPVSSKAEDDFGFAPYADVLCDTILQTPTRSLPFCIGIFGPWGSGKSSFMKMLQVMIEEQAGKPAQESPVHDEQPGQGAAGGKILMTWFRKSGKLIGQEAKHVKVQTIWFNPWKYDKKEDLWNALIQTILDEIIKGSKNKEVLRKAQKLALAATWLTLKKAATTLTAGVIDASNLDEIVKSFRD